MLQLSSEIDYIVLRKYLSPLQKDKLPDNIKFNVASGKKNYDIIRLYEGVGEEYSQRCIEVL